MAAADGSSETAPGRAGGQTSVAERSPAPPPPGAPPAACVATMARTLAEAEAFAAFHRRHGWHPESQHDLWFAALQARDDAGLPFLVQVARDGAPAALLVGQVVDAVVPWRIGYGVLHESRFRQIEVLHGGLLGDVGEANARVLFDEVYRFLRRGGADAVLLRHVPAGSPMHRVFQKRASWSCRDHLVPASTNWRLTLPGGFDGYLAGLSRRTREDLRRFRKKLEQRCAGDCTVERLGRPDDVAQALRIVEQLAAKSWQRALGAGFRDTAETRARWRAAAGRGWLSVHVLWLAGAPAAFCTGYRLGGTLWLEHIGYDPEFRAVQPGGFLLQRVIEQACAEGLAAVDFGVGDADYKRRLCNERHEEVSLYVFAPTVKGIWLNTLRTLTAWAGRVGRAVARRLGLLEAIKGRWRQQLAKPAADDGD